jgi:hypothetical protein
MAVIIGAGTIVTGTSFYETCVVSVNWACNPNIQRLYCLGDWVPTYQFAKPTQTLSIVIYSGTNGPVYTTQPSNDCTVPGISIVAGVDAAGCDAGEQLGVSQYNDWVVTSYGYSKGDPNLPGQETWGLQRWPSGTQEDCNVGSGIDVTQPSNIVRSIAEGQAALESDNSDPGVVFTGVLSYSSTGNVSAASIGRYDRLTYGVASQIGGSDNAAGKTGQGSVSLSYTPLWL